MEEMMQHLKSQFYDVMHKYEKPFTETGVLANLNQWSEAKQPLLELLRCHPNWEEDALAVVTQIREGHPVDGIPFIPQEFRNFLTIFKHGEV